VIVIAVYYRLSQIYKSKIWKESFHNIQVVSLNAEKIFNDFYSFDTVEVLAREHVNRKTLTDWPAVDGHVGR
jgi:hypothetical protein